MRAPLPLVGRDALLARLAGVHAKTRWLTLCGPAGVGKTPLARELAGDGALWCDLAAVRDADGLAEASRRALGRPPEEESSLAELGRALTAAGELVVFDAADGIAATLAPALGGWVEPGNLRVIVTASSPLGGVSERAVVVPPLEHEAARTLWVEATSRLGHRSSEEMAAATAELLEGLPLAIEWLASRASLLGDEASLTWLRRRATSEAPLALALEHTLETLAEDSRRALAVVASFEGGMPTRALEAFAVPLAVVDDLVARALVRVEHRREPRILAYWLVRERVRQLAVDDGTWSELASKHAAWVLDRLADEPLHEEGRVAAERAELDAIAARLTEDDPLRALRALALRARLAFDDGTARRVAQPLRALHRRVATPPAATSIALGILERRLGEVARARTLLTSALPEAPFEASLELAHLDRLQSRTDDALSGYEAALAAARRAGDGVRESIGLGELGRMLQSLGRYREAQRRHVEAIALHTALGLRTREAMERSLHARATHRAGDVAGAVPLHQRALELHRELGRERLEAAELGHLGYCFHELGELDRAEASLRQSIARLARVGDVVLETIERLMLARTLVDAARYGEARLELAVAERLASAFDSPRIDQTRLLIAGHVALASGDRDEARRHWEAGAALGTHVEVGFEALLVAYLAWLDHLDGDRASASRRLATVLRAVKSVEAPGPAAAASIVAAAIEGKPPPIVDDAIFGSSSDVRRALALVAPSAAVGLEVAADGRAFRVAGEDEVDLGRRAAPRRLLDALTERRLREPGRVLTFDELIAAGWPGERIGAEAARKRLRTAIWTLRKMGLEPILLTRDDGYLIDPTVVVARR